jgi:hypothetical protein
MGKNEPLRLFAEDDSLEQEGNPHEQRDQGEADQIGGIGNAVDEQAGADGDQDRSTENWIFPALHREHLRRHRLTALGESLDQGEICLFLFHLALRVNRNDGKDKNKEGDGYRHRHNRDEDILQARRGGRRGRLRGRSGRLGQPLADLLKDLEEAGVACGCRSGRADRTMGQEEAAAEEKKNEKKAEFFHKGIN